MEEVQIVLTSIFLGVAAAVSPGPLMALILSETLKYGKREGFAVAFSPLLTDTPIFLISYFLIYREATSVETVPKVLYIIGGVLLLYFGYKNVVYRYKTLDKLETEGGIISPLLKGLSINALNPYTYGFWFFVAINFYSEDFYRTVLFFIFFFVAFILTEGVIILVVHKTKNFLNERLYTYIIRIVGLVFVLVGLNFLILAVK